MATITRTTPVVSLASIMRAAWAKFGKTYKGCAFREIGRAGFAECLRWAWARARIMAGLVARGPALLKLELAEVARRIASADRASTARGMSPNFSQSMMAERRQHALRERWLRSALALCPVAA